MFVGVSQTACSHSSSLTVKECKLRDWSQLKPAIDHLIIQSVVSAPDCFFFFFHCPGPGRAGSALSAS